LRQYLELGRKRIAESRLCPTAESVDRGNPKAIPPTDLSSPSKPLRFSDFKSINPMVNSPLKGKMLRNLNL